MQTTLVIFARAAVSGAVKTRLAAEIGNARALSVYRALAERTVKAARGAADRVVICFTPLEAAPDMRQWLGGDLEYAAQVEGDLGHRMHAAIERETERGAEAVVIIGTDCPDVTPDVINRAFAALADASVVIGPANDGGYYLIGMRSAHAALFHDVPWSSANTLAVTLQRASAAGLSVAQLETLRDIDVADDLYAFGEERLTA